jgi:hypothetical protein
MLKHSRLNSRLVVMVPLAALLSASPWQHVGATLPQVAPSLRSAQSFAVLAGSTVTNVPSSGTTVTGDLGVSPGTAVAGFPPGIVNGAIHAGDAVAAQAINDLTTAFNDAAGRSVGNVTVAGNLGGQTLTPGLYSSGSSLEISSGDLTLDAQGSANGVFIFQMASTLTTTPGRQVILSGGAKASNVFWQVGTSATLDTTTVFKGNILADQSITLNTGASLEGRALARIGGVSLSSSIISLPATPPSGRFRRGEVNGDSQVNLTDAVFILYQLFWGGPAPPCLDAADADDSGDLTLTDPVFMLNHLFRGGPAPPAPGTQECGADLSVDALLDCAGDC